MKRLSAILVVLILLALPGLAAQLNDEYTPEELLLLWYQTGAMLRENGTYPYVELRKGDTGYEVLALQERLKALNFYDKEIVPVFGGGTEGAMRRFERINKLRVNGWASVDDQQLLFKSLALAGNGLPVSPQASTGILERMPSVFGTATLTPQPTDLITVPPVTVKPFTQKPVTAAPVTAAPVTAEPATPTPDNTLGEPVTAPPTLNPKNIFTIPDNMQLVIPDKLTTTVLPFISQPPFELTQPRLIIPKP